MQTRNHIGQCRATVIMTACLAVTSISGCSFRADQESYGHPFDDSVSNWRQYLGVAVAIQFLLMALALWHTRHRVKMSRMILALVLVPLLWTWPGELLYRLESLLLDWGWPGKMLAVILSFISGTLGTTNIFNYVLGGIVFNDTGFLLYWSVPGVIAGYAAAVLYISGKRGKGEG